MVSDWWVRSFRNLPYSVETGKGFEKWLGMPLFDWLSNNPEEASQTKLWSASMGAESPPHPPVAIAAAWNSVEETARFYLDALRQPACLNQHGSVADELLEVNRVSRDAG